jgi:hypothetical protein
MSSKKNINFKRLAEARTNKVLSAINNLSKLSNRQNYEYGDKEVKQIINCIKKEIINLEGKFKTQTTINNEFKFNNIKEEDL